MINAIEFQRNLVPFRMIMLLILLCCSAGCSAKPRDISKKNSDFAEQDSLWSRDIYLLYMSNDGNWVVFKEDYDIKEDVITLMHTTDSVYFRLEDGEYLNFSNNSKWFGYITPDHEFMLFNLEDHSKQTRKEIYSFNFSDTGDHVAAIQRNPDASQSLLLIDLKDFSATEIKHAGEYKWNPHQDLIAVSINDSSRSKMVLYNISTKKQHILCESETGSYSGLIWSRQGNSLLFTEQSGDNKQLHFHSLNDTTATLTDTTLASLFPGTRIGNRDIFVSGDGKTTFFYREIKGVNRDEQTNPEIWDTKDPWIYPRMKRYNESERGSLLTAWDILSDSLYAVADEETPTVQYNPDFSRAVVYNRLVYEPQYKQYEDVDLYLKDFDTGKKQLIVQRQFNCRGFITLSPKGRYVAYFRECNWWVYDSQSNRSMNLTGDLKICFEDPDDSPKEDKEPYGNPGWSDDEQFIILYDRYDIWLMSPDGQQKQKITNGSAQKISYRISRSIHRNDRKYMDLLENYTGIGFDLKQGVILEMEGDDFQTGYAFWKYGSEVEKLIYGPWKTDAVLEAGDQERIVFSKFRYDKPPALLVLSRADHTTELLYQSNETLLGYNLGKMELLYSGNGKKGSLKGALLYPAEFDPQKKYPMIVYIYEKNAKRINSFSPPSDYEYDGFNILRYVTNGYFVLLPNIEYTTGKPGFSALKSVKALVRQVLRNKSIDKSSVGLIGHSFGGYEVAFIATQTKMFRTVVAGAPVADLISWYHDIEGGGWDTEQMWRLENYQFRMGGSFYDHKNRYYRNSPMHHVEKLNVPLLIWEGKEDYNINWYQSIYMFMAMKRLNKEGRLLLFNDEGHNTIKPDNQKKLSEEVFHWFNFYLKE